MNNLTTSLPTAPSPTVERPAARLGWYTGDNGSKLYNPDGVLVSYAAPGHKSEVRFLRALCIKINRQRLERLHAQQARVAS